MKRIYFAVRKVLGIRIGGCKAKGMTAHVSDKKHASDEKFVLIPAQTTVREDIVTPRPVFLLDHIDIILEECANAYPVEFARKLIKSGGKMTNEKGAFAASRDMDMVALCFERTLAPGKKMIDLGSGDGRIVFLAALFGVQSYGIEYDRTLCKISNDAKRKLVKQKIIKDNFVEFYCGDFFEYDLSLYDVVYVNFGSHENFRLIERLTSDLKPGSILILLWRPTDALLDEFELLFSYRHPNMKWTSTVYRRLPKRQ